MIDLSALTTERRNTETYNLDQMSVHDALIKMNQEDQKVALAVSQALPQVESVTTAVIQSFKKVGRLIYMGAGTSGRLGVLDAAECVPTFGVKLGETFPNSEGLSFEEQALANKAAAKEKYNKLQN